MFHRAILKIKMALFFWTHCAVVYVGRVSAQHMVRTDSREQKLDAFLVSRNPLAGTTSNSLSTVSMDDNASDFVTDMVLHFFTLISMQPL